MYSRFDNILEEKKMAVQKGDKVAIHYIGRLKDGSEFDNSYENGEPIKF